MTHKDIKMGNRSLFFGNPCWYIPNNSNANIDNSGLEVSPSYTMYAVFNIPTLATVSFLGSKTGMGGTNSTSPITFLSTNTGNVSIRHTNSGSDSANILDSNTQAVFPNSINIIWASYNQVTGLSHVGGMKESRTVKLSSLSSKTLVNHTPPTNGVRLLNATNFAGIHNFSEMIVINQDLYSDDNLTHEKILHTLASKYALGVTQ
jgi:hypothetical protein